MISKHTGGKQYFLDSIDKKKLFFSIVTLFSISTQALIINNLGNTSSWGNVFDINIFGILILNNVLFFLIFSFLGNFLILISSFRLIFNPKESSESKLFINERQIHTIGLILYLVGILGYFNFLIFEPFFLVYLILVAIIYYNLTTIEFSPFYQADYSGFNSNRIVDFTVWHPNTKTQINDYVVNQTIEIFLLLSVILLFIQFYLVINAKGDLLSSNKVSKIQKLFQRRILLNPNNSKHKLIITGLFLAFQYISFFTIFISYFLIISFLMLLIYIPFYKKEAMKIELVSNVKVYDIYMLNILIFLWAGFVLGISLNIIVGTAFIISIWLTIKIIDVFRNRQRMRIINKQAELYKVSIDFDGISSFIVRLVLIGYITAWITGNSAESLFLLLIFYTILIKYSPFIIRNFLNSGVIKFSLRRILIMIPMFVSISIIVFVLMSTVGDPVEIILQGRQCDPDDPACIEVARAVLRDRYGLDNPIHIQWGHWIFRFFLGDFGQEIVIGSKPVTVTVLDRLIPTLEISIIPLVFAVFIAIPLGIIASKKQNSLTDNGILIFVGIGLAIPIFFFILVLILFLAGSLRLVPSFGRTLRADVANVDLLYADWFTNGISFEINGYQIMDPIMIQNLVSWAKWDWIFHAIIPIVAITLVSLALLTRLVRGGMLEIMRNDYILSARASGFSEKDIVNKFALRNVLIPVITVLGLSIGFTLGGAPITETVISWPGLGVYALAGLISSDYSVIMGTFMIVALMVLIANLMTDILYSVIDPRVRIE